MSTSGAQRLSSAMAHLTAANMLTLFTAPVTVIAAPGAGKMIVPSLMVAEWKPGAGTYELVSAPVLAYDGDLTNGAVMVTGTNTGTSTTQNVALAVPAAASPPSAYNPNASVVSNKALKLGEPFNGAAPAPGNPIFRGPIVTATIAAPGTGYAPNDTGTIDFDGIAAYRVTTVGALGVVTGFVITNPSNGYDTISNPLSTSTGGSQPGIGTGFTLNVTSVGTADGDLYVTVYYETLALH